MKTKLKVFEHRPDLYPRVLWVANKPEGLDKIFRFMKTGDTQVENPTAYEWLITECKYDGGMCTIPVVRLSDNKIGILVILCGGTTDDIEPDMIPHESVHVADYYFDELGILAGDFTNNEPYAYLVGWIAGKISEDMTKLKKEEDDLRGK